MLELYTDATPNGLKVSIALEEMSLQYQTHQIFLGGEQFSESFTALNPNRKIPVLIDEDLVMTESGAILVYLAEKTGMLLPSDPISRSRAIEMLMFQTASLGPMFGQLLVFAAAWGNEYPEVSNRYFTEVSRLLKVLDTRLEGNSFLAGNEFSIADIACIPWIRLCLINPVGAELPFDLNKNLATWWGAVSSRPAVQRGLATPQPYPDEKQFEGFVDATVGLGKLHVS